VPGPGQRSLSLRLRPQDQSVLRPAARASEDHLVRAHIAALAHDAAHDLVGLSEQGLEILWQGLFDLPTVDLSLHVKLPELITPELQRLRDAVAEDDSTTAGTSSAR
jgi:hypothetical protein